MNSDENKGTVSSLPSVSREFKIASEGSLKNQSEVSVIDPSVNYATTLPLYTYGFNIGKICRLADLFLTSEEKEKYSVQLSSVLDYIQKLNYVETINVEPTSQVTGLENVTRKDEPSPSLSQEEVLKNTKSKHNGLFKVKAIFEEK